MLYYQSEANFEALLGFYSENRVRYKADSSMFFGDKIHRLVFKELDRSFLKYVL